MESWLIQITNYLLAQSWQIAVLTIVVALTSFLLRNRSAHVRYILWLVVLAKCLVPPFYTIPLSILPQEEKPAYFPAPPIAESMISEYRVSKVIATEFPETVSVRSEEISSPMVTEKKFRFDTHTLLAIGWLAGVVTLSFYYLLNALRTQIWLLERRKELPSRFKENIESLLITHGVSRIPHIWLLDKINQPFVWGLVGGSIYLPAELICEKHAKFHMSLLGHELSHIIRLDATINSLQVIAQTVFWFHPLVWWANRKIRVEREKCCDEMTIARFNTRPEDYGEAIVETLGVKYAQARSVPSLAVAGQVKNIEERIRTMLKPGKKFYKRPTFTAGVVVLVLALLTVPTALVLTARAGGKVAPTPLHQAAADGNLNEARSLISKGANVNAKDKKGRTPLFHAIENGHPLMCDLLIAKGTDVNVKDEAGDTPLHHAARDLNHYKPRLADQLVRRGADVNATNNQNQTSLHIALEGGSSYQYHIASILLRYDVKVNIKDSNGRTAFHLAAQRTVEEPRPWWRSLLRIVLAKGAEVNLTDAKGQTALHIACSHNTEGQNIIKTLLERDSGINVNVIDKDGVTPLHIAARRGQRDVCEILINNGAEINTGDKYGHTPAYHALRFGSIETADWLIKRGGNMSPIHLAAYQGNISNLKTLLTRGASANEKDETGFSALHAAAAGGHRGIVEYLISQGADVKAKGGPGWTALSYAARGNAKKVVELLRAEGVGGAKEVSILLPIVIKRGYADMASTLIALGADIDFNKGEPLRTAVGCGYKEIVEFLISKGADVNAGEGQATPLFVAARSGRIDIAERLLDAGANVNGVNARKQRWPLETAVFSEDMKMTKFLLSKGADVNKGVGWSVLHEAVDRGNKDIIALLIKHGANIDRGEDWSSLGLAASYWYGPEIVKLLIDGGGNVNAVAPKSGFTPLHWAARGLRWADRGNNRRVFDLLVSRGADVNVRTNNKETVLHLLIQWGRKPDEVKFVLSRGVDINAADACGWAALHRAVLYDLPEIVELLIDEGADVNLKDNDGRTPLWLAKERGQKRIVELLCEHSAKE